MSKKQILGIIVILIFLCFVCKFIYTEFKVDEAEKQTKLVITETDKSSVKFDLYYTDDDVNYYVYNLDKIIVDYGDRKLELNRALETKQITMDFVLEYVKNNGTTDSYWDGGTNKYSNSELSVLECKTLDGNSDYYFGPSNMEYKEGFCKDEPYICQFVRTYLIVDISESNDENFAYLTLREFQGEDVVTVKVKKQFTIDMIEEAYYEFTFGSLGNLDEDIKSLFDNNRLLSVVMTDKIGLEQINDSICR